MSIKKRVGAVVVVSIAILVGVLLFQNLQQSKTVTAELGETVSLISEKTEQEVETSLKNTSGSIAEYTVALEKKIDDSMLNAAYYVQEAYANNPDLKDSDLKKLLEKLNMTDLLICNQKGDFTIMTDPASRNVNLFEVWDGYRALLTDPDLELLTNLKISEETGSIFKYAAIPRRDGKGCIEAALNSDSVKNELSVFIEATQGFSSFTMVDSANLVLISLGDDETVSTYVEGQISDDAEFTEIFSSGTEKILSEEGASEESGKITMYYPVLKDGEIAYAFRLTLEKEPYFADMKVLSDNTTKLVGTLQGSLRAGIIVNVIILLIMMVSIMMSINHIMKPVVSLANISRKVSEGDLNVSLEGKYYGEIEVLVKAFNSMTRDLHTMLKNVTQTSGTIKDSSNNLRSSLEVITHSGTALSTAMEEISQGTNSLARDNSDAYENTMELSSQIENMSSNLAEVNNSITTIGAINQMGMDTIDNLDTHFQSSMQAIDEAAVKVEELQEKSNSINNIIAAISDIASQTNLLALNASIEAARAGEQGKGFAVVAEEVRKLAESSTRETQEISMIMKEIIDIIKITAEKMNFTKKMIVETNSALFTTKEMFGNLNMTAGQMADYSQEIIDSVSHVSEATEVLLNLVASISSVSEEVAASSKAVSESSQQQSGELDSVNSQIITMDEVTNELNGILEKYQI